MRQAQYKVYFILHHQHCSHIGDYAHIHYQLCIDQPSPCGIFLKKVLIKIYTCTCILCHFTTWRWCRLLKSFLVEVKDQLILHIQYHSCWWPGTVRSLDKSSHGIDLVLAYHSGFSTRRANLISATVNNDFIWWDPLHVSSISLPLAAILRPCYGGLLCGTDVVFCAPQS